MRPWFKGFAVGFVAGVTAIVATAGVVANSTQQQPAPAAVSAAQEPASPAPAPQQVVEAQQSPWARATGNLWTGVVLYYGEGDQKMQVGEVLGGSDSYVDPATGQQLRGLKVRMKSGKPEWKDRDAVIGGPWYVRRDDPAIANMAWKTYVR